MCISNYELLVCVYGLSAQIMCVLINEFIKIAQQLKLAYVGLNKMQLKNKVIISLLVNEYKQVSTKIRSSHKKQITWIDQIISQLN